MEHPLENAPRPATSPPAPRSLWITLEAPEIIELKRIAMDGDSPGAVSFFRSVLIPRLQAAMQQRGLALDLPTEVESDERLPG